MFEGNRIPVYLQTYVCIILSEGMSFVDSFPVRKIKVSAFSVVVVNVTLVTLHCRC